MRPQRPGITFLSRDAAPCHRSRCVHLLQCRHQHGIIDHAGINVRHAIVPDGITGRAAINGFSRSASSLGASAGGRDPTSETDARRGTAQTDLPAGARAPTWSPGAEPSRGSARGRARSASPAGSVGAPARPAGVGGASRSASPAPTLSVDGVPLAAGEGLPAGQPQFPKKPGENARQWKRRIHRTGARPGGSARAVLRPPPPPGNR